MSELVEIDYTNHRGERRTRRITPLKIMFTDTKWHPEKQWILLAYDEEKQQPRMFALADVHEWRPGSNSSDSDSMSKCPGCGAALANHTPENEDTCEAWEFSCGSEIYIRDGYYSIEEDCSTISKLQLALRKFNSNVERNKK